MVLGVRDVTPLFSLLSLLALSLLSLDLSQRRRSPIVRVCGACAGGGARRGKALRPALNSNPLPPPNRDVGKERKRKGVRDPSSIDATLLKMVGIAPPKSSGKPRT